MALEHHPTKRDTYLSLSAGYPPTSTSRTYGGHVFAQSAWAAAHTVPHGLHVHSMTGYFLLQGDTRYAFEYRVRRVRDGGIYALRIIEAYQDSPAAANGKSPTFIGIASFKRDERNKHKSGAKGQRKDFAHQELPKDFLNTEYGAVLNGKRFEDFQLAQGTDGMWLNDLSIDEWKQRGTAFPGVEMRKVDMRGYNPNSVPQGGLADGGEKASKWRLLMMYRLVEGDEELKGKNAASDLINENACAHLYASDRNSLFLALRALGFERDQGQVGSLSHTVNFHGDAVDLMMGKKVFVQEQWISSSGADRVTHTSRIWDQESGKILASTVQDGMMRMPVGKSREVVDGEALLRREAKL